jgi:hypothetical protein
MSEANTRLMEVSNVSSVNRYLLRGKYEPCDLFKAVVAKFIGSVVVGENHLIPECNRAVNA